MRTPPAVTTGSQRIAVALVGESAGGFAAELALALRGDDNFALRSVEGRSQLAREFEADTQIALCPLRGAFDANAALSLACSLGVGSAIVAYDESGDAAAAVDILRIGALDVLHPARLASLGSRLRDTLQLVQMRKAFGVARREIERNQRFFVEGPVIVFRWRAAPDWPVDYVSPNVVQLFGVSAEDFVSGRKPYASSVHPEDLERVAREVAAHSASGVSSFDQEYRIVRPDGEVRWLYDHTLVVRNTDGALTHFEGYVFDVTQLERERRTRALAERQLFDAQKLESLGMLAGGVAHDFNNLLTTILGEAGLVLASEPPGSATHAAVANIAAAARNASGLTRQMLAYAGRASGEATECDVRALVRDMTRLLESGLPKNVQLQLRLGPTPVTVLADPSQLQLVVLNLALNGAEACAERGGRVTLEVALERASLLGGLRNDSARIEVVDTGCGMDAATVARSTEPFFSTKFRGRGLGLSAVLGIVRAHGGELHFDSQPGKGTTARVRLPALSAPTQPPAPPPSPAAARGERVLVIDDEAMVASIAARCLQMFGYSTATAAGGREGLAILDAAKGSIDCVLLDRTMPDLSGEETLELLREKERDLVVVLTSGFDEGESLIAARRASPDAFLRKPYSPDELARTVRNALDAAQERRAGAASPLS
jgi:PAS domain S-box-containing protein